MWRINMVFAVCTVQISHDPKYPVYPATNVYRMCVRVLYEFTQSSYFIIKMASRIISVHYTNGEIVWSNTGIYKTLASHQIHNLALEIINLGCLLIHELYQYFVIRSILNIIYANKFRCVFLPANGYQAEKIVVTLQIKKFRRKQSW